MKILNAIKKLVPAKLLNKQKKSYQDACDLIMQLVAQEKRTHSNKPQDLSVEEWERILNDIAFAFKVKKQNTFLKSPTRRAERAQRVKRAFELFQVYIKHL